VSHRVLTERRARGESEALESSRFSLSSQRAGRIGRIREDRRPILPDVNLSDESQLQQSREDREDSLQLYTCAGAAHGNRIYSTAGAPPESPYPPSAALWAALVNKEDIYAIAYRLGLSSTDTVGAWRLAALRVARSDGFIQAVPQDVPMTRRDWERWKALEASPRKLLGLLRKLIYGVRIWD